VGAGSWTFVGDVAIDVIVNSRHVWLVCIISSRALGTVGRQSGSCFPILSIENHKCAVSSAVNPPRESHGCGRSPSCTARYTARSRSMCPKGNDMVPRA